MAEWAEEGGDGAVLWRRTRHSPVSDAHRGWAPGSQRYAAGVGTRQSAMHTGAGTRQSAMHTGAGTRQSAMHTGDGTRLSASLATGLV
jgi:hypothetical protein